MDYKVLYRKYRPDNFANIVGQPYIVNILKNAIKNNHISHAYIFSGPRGTGKTSTAKVFAKAINCLNPTENGPCNNCDSCKHFKENADIIEIDAASNNGVDEIREIINNIKLAPAYSKYKVYIIDEVHMLSTSAFNALLLTLEEPPKHVVFILATTNIEAVLPTILSRCQRFDFRKLALQDIIKRLDFVVKEENISIAEEALEEIAYISDGGMRDALSMLDQLSSTTSNITIKDIEEHFGTISKKEVSELYNCILDNNLLKFTEMMKKFKNLAIDYKVLIRKMLEQIEEQAILSKEDYNYKGLKYELLKKMAYDLASISNYVNLSVNPYLLIEINLLNYFPGNNLMTTKMEQVQEINHNIIDDNHQSINSKETLVIDDNLIARRINNCFVNPKKEFLLLLKAQWINFLKNINNKTIKGLILDTDIIAASDKIAIISCNNESTMKLINAKLKDIETEYNNLIKSSYQFIAITPNIWQEKKQEYAENKKKNILYQYINEPMEVNIEEKNVSDILIKNIDDIDEVALKYFDKDIIEIE